MGPRQLWQPGLGEHPIHRAMVDAQLPGDGPHQPPLDMEVAQDLGLEFYGDGQGYFLARATPGPVQGLCARLGGGRCTDDPSRRWRKKPRRTNAEQARPPACCGQAEMTTQTFKDRHCRLVRGRRRCTRLGGQWSTGGWGG